MRHLPLQRFPGQIPDPFAVSGVPPIVALGLLPSLSGLGMCFAGAAGAAEPPAMPARFYMRPYKIPLGTQVFTYGGPTLSFDLAREGYTEGLLVQIDGTYTVANAPLVFNAFQPYNSVAKFLATIAQSPLPPINIGGWSAHLWNLRNMDFAALQRQFRFPAQGALDANAFHAGRVDQFPVALGAQAAHLEFFIPFHLSADDIRGILPTGNMSQVSLKITPAAIADLVTVPANFTLQNFTCKVDQFCLTPPPANAKIIGGGVDLSQAVAYDEFPQNIAVVGLQRVPIDPTYTILGILHGVAIANVMDSADITLVNVKFNSSFANQPPGIGMDVQDSIQAGQYGVPMPQGVIIHDQDILGMADWVHTGDLTTIESQITVGAAGAPASILTSTRRLVPLAAM